MKKNRKDDNKLMDNEKIENVEIVENTEKAENVENTDKKKKKARRIRGIIIALIILLLLGLAAACCGYEMLRPKSRQEIDKNALEGFLPGKSEEEIQAELNRIIDESRFNITINTMITYENKEADVRIENVPANHYYMQVDLYIYPDENSTDNPQLFYKSGIIPQGRYIEKAEASTDLPQGYYNGLAVFHAIYPDKTMEEVGSTSMNVVILVK